MHRSTLTCLLGSLLTLILLAGCSRGPEGAAPTGPATGPSAGGPVFLTTPPAPIATPQGATFVAKLIGAKDGGELKLGNVAISFPKGSLPFSALVSISTLGEGLVGLRVEPAGLVLVKPALVKIEQLDRTNEKAFRALRMHLRQGSNSLPLETRRDGNRIEGDAQMLGEFRIGSEPSDSTEIQWLYCLSGPGYTTVLIKADDGGKVVYGRYQVTLPKGALAADTYITVRDPDNEFVSCELEPHGTQFLVPVELQIDLRDLQYLPFTDWSIYWLAAEDQWQDQGGTFVDGKVRANLWHFSVYAPGRGRAGW